MAFTHGTYASEKESSIKGIITVQNPVVVVGAAPINMGDINSVNKVELIQSAKDAVEKFGTSNYIEGFNITEAIYVALNVFGVTPIVCINVLDPNKHKTTEEYDSLAVVDKKVTFEHTGILLDTLEVKTGDTSLPIEEFTASFGEDGKLTIEIEEEVTTIEGSYSYLDPSKVTDTDIIGSVDPSTSKNTGLECIKELFSKYSMIPSYVITPGYTSNELRAVLDTKGSLVGNKWKAMTIVDLPENTKYGEAISYKKQNNWIDEDQIVCFGKVRFGGKYYNQSIFAAFLSASIDNDNDGVPYESPSNKNIKAEGISWKNEDNYEDLSLSEEEANLLNENGICTIITRSNGTVFWGNRTSVFQPGGNTDPKDMWIPAKRMFKYLANTVMLNNENEVDKPMTKSKAESIKMNINRFLASLVAQEKLLGASIDFTEEDNSTNDLINGIFTWHIKLGIVFPGETLNFVLEYDDEYLAAYFG
ncbi:MAG: phage tail sheath subtilisin-like domain-containing protein [Fusobacterium sp.]|nr:phage tail sheath subtilisin-like domain-containing protein [Fusobacterium sp.]MDO5789044.1 phage tail sheath subtilisin-like domain-containing protein [Fusobacterium sp.]